MSIRRAARLSATVAAIGLLSGCIYSGRARGAFYPTQVYGSGAVYSNYGFTQAYAPGTAYYAGGYYGGSYYRPGYYYSSAPFVTVQAAPSAYAQPAYAQPPVYNNGGYVQPAQPVYAQPPSYGGGGYVQTAQPAYAQPPVYNNRGGAYAQPAARGTVYVQPPSGGISVSGSVNVAPRAGVPVAR